MTESTPTTTDNQPPATPSAPAPRKKRRRWLKVLLALFVLGVVLVLLLPTLLSTSPARNFALGQAAAFVPNGKLEVADWSFGWLSPIRLKGVKLLDAKGQPIIEADEVKTDLTLLQAARQSFNLGDTVVDAAAHLVVYEDGSNNLQRALAAKHAPKDTKKTDTPASSGDATVPNVTGNINLKLRGDLRLVDAVENTKATLRLQPGSGGTVKITDINQPIDTDLKFIIDAGDNTKPGTVLLKASADAIESNKLQLANAAGAIDLNVADIDTAGFGPLLAVAKVEGVKLAGIVAGALKGELKQGQSGAIKGGFTVTNIEVAAPPLADVYKAKLIELPIELARDVSNGLSRLKLDVSAKTPELTSRISGDVSEATLQRLAAKQMPGETGVLAINTTIDPSKLAAALPKTLRLPPNVTVDSGALTNDITLTIATDAIQANVKTNAVVTGKQDGKPIAIDPVHLVADTRVTNLENPVAGLRQMSLSLTSAFAAFTGGGESVATLKGNGQADLGKARQQIAQFVDLGKLSFAGLAKFDLTSTQNKDDATALRTDVTANVIGLNVALPDKPAINVPLARLIAVADLATDASGVGVKQVKTATVNLLAGDSEQQPLVTADLVATAFDPATMKLGTLSLKQLLVPDFPRLQKVIDPFVPALREQKLELAGGSIDAKLEANDIDLSNQSLNLKTLNATLPKLWVKRDGREFLRDSLTFDVGAKVPDKTSAEPVQAVLRVRGDAFTVTGKNIAVAMPAEGVPAFKLVKSADFDITAKDLAKLTALLKTAAPAVTLPADPSGNATIVAKVKDGVADVVVNAQKLAVTNAAGKSFAFDPAKPVNLTLSAKVDGNQAIESVRITKLTGDFDVATLSTPKEIVITNLANAPAAAGEVTLAGSLDRVLELLAVIQAAEKRMPYNGQFSFTQTVSPKNGAIALVGRGTVNDFAVLDEKGKATFKEQQVAINNDIAVDTAKQIATIATLTLDMAASKAAHVEVTGGVEKWSADRVLKDVNVKVDADGPKVWPIVYSFLPPAQQEQHKETKLIGPITVRALANGAYPAMPTWNESIRTVTAYGDVFVKGVDTMGLAVSDFALPFSVVKQKDSAGREETLLITGDMRKKGAARFAKPFNVNDGLGDFGSIVLNVGEPDLKLSIGRKQKLLQKVKLNPVLASQLGSLASVVFTDAKDASGLLDFTVVDCQNVPLMDLMNKKATASFVYSVHDLKLDGPVPSALSSALQWGSQGIVGDIENATLDLKKGIAHQNMTLALQREARSKNDAGREVTETKTETMTFKGGVDLATNKFSNYSLGLSSGLLLRDWRKNFPDGATVGLTGNVTDVKSILAQAVGQLAIQGYGGGAIDKLLEGLGEKKDKKKAR